MSNKLAQALRCKSVSEKCEYLECPYYDKFPTFGFSYSRIICHRERIWEDATETIEHLETENAALREQFQDTFQAHLLEEIKRLEQKNTALYLQLDKVKKQAGLWKKRFKMEEKANEISTEELLNVTAERDAALNDLAGFCWACAHGEPAKIRTRGLTTCNYMRELGALAQGGRCKCKHWQWRGLQKEDGGND